LLICMRSRTKRKCGEVYRPVLVGLLGDVFRVYCASIEEMKALVDPLPFVPATCMGFSCSKSEGCE
jgi:hypothetical protein